VPLQQRLPGRSRSWWRRHLLPQGWLIPRPPLLLLLLLLPLLLRLLSRLLLCQLLRLLLPPRLLALLCSDPRHQLRLQQAQSPTPQPLQPCSAALPARQGASSRQPPRPQQRCPPAAAVAAAPTWYARLTCSTTNSPTTFLALTYRKACTRAGQAQG
jgi:hypothetical protein